MNSLFHQKKSEPEISDSLHAVRDSCLLINGQAAITLFPNRVLQGGSDISVAPR